jgi:hypothetical protein
MYGLAFAALFLLGPPGPSTAPPEPLSFREFFDPSPRGLKPSARLLGLQGKRVRLTGFMAQMESPPRGGFYMCASPVFATEGGGGTADLPPDTVLVVMRSAQGKELDHVQGPLEVTGVLDLGSQVDEEGRVSRIRILLDGRASAPPGVGPPPPATLDHP